MPRSFKCEAKSPFKYPIADPRIHRDPENKSALDAWAEGDGRTINALVLIDADWSLPFAFPPDIKDAPGADIA